MSKGAPMGFGIFPFSEKDGHPWTRVFPRVLSILGGARELTFF